MGQREVFYSPVWTVAARIVALGLAAAAALALKPGGARLVPAEWVRALGGGTAFVAAALVAAACAHELHEAEREQERPDHLGTAAWLLLALAVMAGCLSIVFSTRPGDLAGLALIVVSTAIFGAGVTGFVGLARDARKGRALVSTLVAGGVMSATYREHAVAPDHRKHTRSCYVNQKTIVGAIEMYNLDKNTKREGLDAAFYAALKSGGYLQAIPDDPGQGPGTNPHYQLTAGGNGIKCEVHGPIQ